MIEFLVATIRTFVKRIKNNYWLRFFYSTVEFYLQMFCAMNENHLIMPNISRLDCIVMCYDVYLAIGK